MLDDLKLIHERDAQDTLGVVGDQWQQLLHTFEARGGRSLEPRILAVKDQLRRMLRRLS